MIDRVAGSDATVLITGESGTGKKLVALGLHTFSPRVAHPFVPVNCASLPDDLLESELFGNVRGAFAGTLASRIGMFQRAEGGTILLDEIGEMSFSLQAKLLRILQSREVRAVGSDRSTGVDVRVIAATNKDLMAAVKDGTFREDLFYRLHVIPIHLPPLRARRSDIPLLVNNFLERHNQKYDSKVQISPEAMVYLREYDWPGNVTEVENLIERMVILSDEDQIGPKDLPPYLRSFISEKKLPNPTFNNGEVDLRQALEQFEDRLIDEALRRTNGNKSKAAELLGLKRTTLVAKIRRKRNMNGTSLENDDGNASTIISSPDQMLRHQCEQLESHDSLLGK